ncbi:MAG: preQ(1) synthase [Calditrichia bacterium]
MSEYTEKHAQSIGETPEIEVWPNQYKDRDYWIEVSIPEFTCVCPRTGLPDFATVNIRYIPDETCMELKSLKMYMIAYRNMGIFHENVANKIRDDIIKACNPRKLEVETDFNIRGGIHTVVKTVYEK